MRFSDRTWLLLVAAALIATLSYLGLDSAGILGQAREVVDTAEALDGTGEGTGR